MKVDETKPKLERKQKFVDILKDYRPSDEAITILDQAQALFLVGITASGRNTLIEYLLKTEKFYHVLSDTTRPPRMHGDRLERDGEFYWHVTEEKFLNGLENGDYLEAAVIHNQQVSGSNSTEYKRATDAGKIAVTDIDGIHGPPTFRRYSKNAQFIFMVPPGFKEWMRRLNSRGTMTQDELKNRFTSSVAEIEAALERPYYDFLVSRDLVHNTETTLDITSGNHLNDNNIESKEQARKLLVDIKQYMSDNNL